MKELFLSVWLAIAGLFGLAPEGNDHDHEHEEMPMPTGNPGQSAPPQTIIACADKIIGDACVFTLGGPEVEGVCSASGDELACGPTAVTLPQ